MFNRERFFKALQGSAVGQELFSFKEVDSTNIFLKEHAPDLAHGAAAVADVQTAGRGRRGSQWDTHPGVSLALSLLLRPRQPAGISILCAVAAVKAAAGLCGGNFGIKWPNDIVWEGRKICGILCEAKTDARGVAVVCGFGINLLQDEEYFSRAGLPFAASLRMASGADIAREDAAAAVCRSVDGLFRDYESRGMDAVLGEYRKSCVTLGREVRFLKNGVPLRGTAVDILPDGSLSVACPEGKIALNSGEVSVRGLYGYV